MHPPSADIDFFVIDRRVNELFIYDTMAILWGRRNCFVDFYIVYILRC